MNPQKFYEKGLRLLKLHGSISWQIEADGTFTEEQTMGRSLVGREFVGLPLWQLQPRIIISDNSTISPAIMPLPKQE